MAIPNTAAADRRHDAVWILRGDRLRELEGRSVGKAMVQETRRGDWQVGM